MSITSHPLKDFSTKDGALLKDDGRKTFYDDRCAQSPMTGIIVHGAFANDEGCRGWTISVHGADHRDFSTGKLKACVY